MNRKGKFFACLACSFACMIFQIVGQAEPVQSVTLGLLEDNPPWSEYSDGKWSGISVDSYRVLLSEINRPIEIHGYDNYPRILAEFTNGRVDVFSAIAIDIDIDIHELLTPNNTKFACSRTPFAISTWGAYALESSNIEPVATLSELNNLRIGRIRMASPFMEKLGIVYFFDARSSELLRRVLVAKRIDLAIVSEKLAQSWRSELRLETTEVMNFGEFTVHPCYSQKLLRENPGLLDRGIPHTGK